MVYRSKQNSKNSNLKLQKNMKKYLTSLVIKEIQIITTVGFHLTPVRMAGINNTGNSSCWQVYGK